MNNLQNKFSDNPLAIRLPGFYFISKSMQLLIVISLLAALGLAGCGGGASNEVGPGGGGNIPTAYSGPAASTDLVQQFQNTIWPHLKAECGNCHVPGTQEPSFANNNNVNQAYNSAISVTVLGSPADSELVTKVGSGHNCWLTTNAECAQVMTNWIYEWAGGPAASAREITLVPPAYTTPGDSRSYPIDASLFQTYVWPRLQNNCVACHSDSAPLQSQQSPFFASDDINTAYEEAKAKIDLSDGDIALITPISDKVAKSRLVIRPRDQNHNLCSPDCQTVALDIRDGIIEFASRISPSGVDPSLNYSGALTFNDGVIASGGNRYEANQVALWEFKGGASNPNATTVSDVSLSGGLDLNFSGSVNWVPGYGIELSGGAAKATSTDSQKLYDAIVGDPITWGAVGEYSVEAWVIPANVTQENRYIASYTLNGDTQNFALGQTMYNYDFVQRTDGAASTTLSTPDADEVLQANLQHVVTTYDAINGRRIYVNGVLTNVVENVPPTNLSGWQNNYIFAIGDAASGNGRAWEGQVRMMAIYNRALTHEQVVQNLEVGVGEKRFLLFDVSQISGEASTYIMFEVSQPDAYSYLFYKPTFIKITGNAIDPNWVPVAPIIIKDMRIGINGQLATLGQAYATLDTQIDATQYTTESGQVLSTIGTVIPVVNGSVTDEFFLSFEEIGSSGSSPFAENDPAAPPRTDPGNPQLIGLRTFEEINATMSDLTGVDSTIDPIGGLAGTYTTYKQQFPSVENIQAFLPAHQMAIAQLAMTYCDELVQDTTLRSSYFPAFNFGSNAGTAFDLSGRNALINPLIERMMNVVDPQGSKIELATQPETDDQNPVTVPIDDEGVRTELDGLIDTLTVCATGATPSCNTVARTESVATATCASMLGTAVILIQ